MKDDPYRPLGGRLGLAQGTRSDLNQQACLSCLSWEPAGEHPPKPLALFVDKPGGRAPECGRGPLPPSYVTYRTDLTICPQLHAGDRWAPRAVRPEQCLHRVGMRGAC